MDFQRARTKEQIGTRENEIVSACIKLYSEKGYDGVSLMAISKLTSITRPSIYNYFKTKGEIFMEILSRDYLDWIRELEKALDSEDRLTRSEYCHILTKTIIHRERMLRLISMNLREMEDDSTVERIAGFKTVIVSLLELISESIVKFFPETSAEEKDTFISLFLTFLFGLYTYTHPTEKQIEAMEIIGLSLVIDMETICYEGLLKLSSGLIEE